MRNLWVCWGVGGWGGLVTLLVSQGWVYRSPVGPFVTRIGTWIDQTSSSVSQAFILTPRCYCPPITSLIWTPQNKVYYYIQEDDTLHVHSLALYEHYDTPDLNILPLPDLSDAIILCLKRPHFISNSIGQILPRLCTHVCCWCVSVI